MPDKDNDILKYNPGEKCMKVPFVIYDNLECLLENISICHNNPEKSSPTKINKHTRSGYSLFTHCSFDTTKNSEYDCYRGEDCMEKFCKTLKKTCRKNNWLGKKQMKKISLMKNKDVAIYAKKDLLMIIKK